jgi:hypothetical protein
VHHNVICRLKAGISKSEKKQRRPLPGNGSMSVFPAATSALEMESACCLGMKACSRDNADVASMLDAIYRKRETEPFEKVSSRPSDH